MLCSVSAQRRLSSINDADGRKGRPSAREARASTHQNGPSWSQRTMSITIHQRHVCKSYSSSVYWFFFLCLPSTCTLGITRLTRTCSLLTYKTCLAVLASAGFRLVQPGLHFGISLRLVTCEPVSPILHPPSSHPRSTSLLASCPFFFRPCSSAHPCLSSALPHSFPCPGPQIFCRVVCVSSVSLLYWV